MNKRISRKRIKQYHQDVYNRIFNLLESGFTPVNKQYTDGYFVFVIGAGVNSVCHFEIKELPDWRFGIWIDENEVVKLFGEHKHNLHKFKPYSTYFTVRNNVEKFMDTVKELHDNPHTHLLNTIFGYSYEHEFSKEELEVKMDDYYTWIRDDTRERQLTRREALKQIQDLLANEHVVAIGVQDTYPTNMFTSSRYLLTLVFEKGLTFDKKKEISKQLNKEIATSNKSHRGIRAYEEEAKVANFLTYDFHTKKALKKYTYTFYK